MRGRPWEWLAPAGATPTGVGSAHGQATGGGCLLRGRKGQPHGQGCRSYRGSARARRHRPPARCRPRATTPAAGAAAHVDSVQRCRLRGATMAAA
ncbi:hypothetical protein GW17_00036280 [Ensete ventricosum]|nr:hypothetical protein GW17_00036280 [Ensete ventricosum]